MTFPLEWPLSPFATAVCAIALFGGYAVRGVAGFGSGVVATPLMAMVLPLSTVAPIITFIGAFVSVRQALADWKHIAWRPIAEFVPGIALGVPLGIWAFKTVDPAVLIRALGGYVLVYACYSLFGARLRAANAPLPRWTAVPIGTLGSVVATLFGGMAGPVYVTYLDGLRMDKRTFRVTTSTTLLALNLVRSVAYVASGVFALQNFTLVAAAALPAALGTWAGDRLHDRIGPGAFRASIAALLLASGVALLLR